MSHQTESELYRSEGYNIDETCYPWVAYRGSRFNPDVWHRIMTDRESQLKLALKTVTDGMEAASEQLDYCGGGDAWERECYRDSGKEELVSKAVELLATEDFRGLLK